MTTKVARAANQAMADSSEPTAKKVQATKAQGIPPPPVAAPLEDLPVIHGRPRLTLPAPSLSRPAEDFVTPMDKVIDGSNSIL
jgi:hypothetical protein